MKKILASVMIGVMLLSGCSVIDSISNEIVDQVSNVVQSTDKYVVTIQNANMNGTTHTYKDVFDNFFAYPTWKHFTSDDGQEVVEFTGECTYDNQNVKALIQFAITNENGDYLEWETRYLSFNNVSQPLIMLAALLEKAVLEYENKAAREIEIKNDSADLSEKELIKVVQKNLSVPYNSRITYTIGKKQYNEVWDAYYVSVDFYENGKMVAGANVDIKTGELISNIMGYIPTSDMEDAQQEEVIISVDKAKTIAANEAKKQLPGSGYDRVDEIFKERESSKNYLICVTLSDGFSGAAYYYRVNKKTGMVTYMGANQVGWEALDGCEEFK